MTLLVDGKEFYGTSLTCMEKTPLYDFITVGKPIEASCESLEGGWAMRGAEHELAEKAGDADGLIAVDYRFPDPKLFRTTCVVSGIPIKRLN